METIITALSCPSYSIVGRSKSDVRSQYVKALCISCPHYDKQILNSDIKFSIDQFFSSIYNFYHSSLHKTPLLFFGSHDIFIPLVFCLPLLSLVITFWGFSRPTFSHHYFSLYHFCTFTLYSCYEFILTPNIYFHLYTDNSQIPTSCPDLPYEWEIFKFNCLPDICTWMCQHISSTTLPKLYSWFTLNLIKFALWVFAVFFSPANGTTIYLILSVQIWVTFILIYSINTPWNSANLAIDISISMCYA